MKRGKNLRPQLDIVLNPAHAPRQPLNVLAMLAMSLPRVNYAWHIECFSSANENPKGTAIGPRDNVAGSAMPASTPAG
jgi:hypothetical protein